MQNSQVRGVLYVNILNRGTLHAQLLQISTILQVHKAYLAVVGLNMLNVPQAIKIEIDYLRVAHIKEQQALQVKRIKLANLGTMQGHISAELQITLINSFN